MIQDKNWSAVPKAFSSTNIVNNQTMDYQGACAVTKPFLYHKTYNVPKQLIPTDTFHSPNSTWTSVSGECIAA